MPVISIIPVEVGPKYRYTFPNLQVMNILKHITPGEMATGAILLSALLGIAVELIVVRILKRQNHPLETPFRRVLICLVPTSTILSYLQFIQNLPENHRIFRVVATAFWIEVIWLVTLVLSLTVYHEGKDRRWKTRVPNLFLDLSKFGVLFFGAILVIAGVWERDLGGFLATLGVGSLVLGLALQDTLGNLFAGIALLFEGPFVVGDWIKVGDTIGEIVEMNWRACRIRTRDNDIVIVPNSILGKERLLNFTSPSTIHGILLYVSFSYNDPPNKVKRALEDILKKMDAPLSVPRPSIRTKKYEDSSILYEIRFFINSYPDLPEIEQDFMTRVWYAARRNGLTFPFPIRTIYKTEVPLTQMETEDESEVERTLHTVQLFQPLDKGELKMVSRDAVLMSFARGERIVEQNDAGDALYIIKSGLARVSVRDAAGHEQKLAQLTPGQFFGEMALLAGEERTATVTAEDDLEVVAVFRDAITELLQNRPELAEEMAQIAAKRKAHRAEVESAHNAEAHSQSEMRDSTKLLSKIKGIFGI